MVSNIKEERSYGHDVIHRYRVLTEKSRPQDPSFELKGWKFECYEYGGGFSETFPLVIRGTDPEGRTCSYHPLKGGDGNYIDSISFEIPL